MVDSINLYNENTKYANLYTHAISGIKDILWFPFEMCGNLVKVRNLYLFIDLLLYQYVEILM